MRSALSNWSVPETTMRSPALSPETISTASRLAGRTILCPRTPTSRRRLRRATPWYRLAPSWRGWRRRRRPPPFAVGASNPSPSSLHHQGRSWPSKLRGSSSPTRYRHAAGLVGSSEMAGLAWLQGALEALLSRMASPCASGPAWPYQWSPSCEQLPLGPSATMDAVARRCKMSGLIPGVAAPR